MDNNVTELVFILDKSGSMHGLEDDTVDGFNSMIEDQKKQAGKVWVSTVLFSNRSEVLHDRVELENVGKMTEKEYRTGGNTALLDAVGDAIHHIGSIHKYARKEDVPAKTLFIIATDGMENASHRYSYRDVKEMIRRQEEKYGWEFVFVAANIDAAETADELGICRENAANYRYDESGTREMYACMSAVVKQVRGKGKIDADWSEGLNNGKKK